MKLRDFDVSRPKTVKSMKDIVNSVQLLMPAVWEEGILSLKFVVTIIISLDMVCKYHTGCLTTDMNKVSAFFMEISTSFIENYDHILFTMDVSFIILPYLGKKNYKEIVKIFN